MNPERKRDYQRRARLRAMRNNWAGELIGKARRRARQRGMEFDLTEEWARARWTGRCELTGIAFVLSVGEGQPHSYGASLDRIDNTRGYLKDNCRFILWVLNEWKSARPEADLQDFIGAMSAACAASRQEAIGFCA